MYLGIVTRSQSSQRHRGAQRILSSSRERMGFVRFVSGTLLWASLTRDWRGQHQTWSDCDDCHCLRCLASSQRPQSRAFTIYRFTLAFLGVGNSFDCCGLEQRRLSWHGAFSSFAAAALDEVRAKMEITETLCISNRSQWRAWLEKHHTEKTEIWLVYPRKSSGKLRIPYTEAVEEALCFGWIDGIEKKFDDQSSAQRFTPRKRNSNWSELNKARARRLIQTEQMAEAGLSALGSVLETPLEIPSDIAKILRADAQTQINFELFSDEYRRIRIGYIEEMRKRPEEFQKRLNYFLRMTKQNKKFGTFK